MPLIPHLGFHCTSKVVDSERILFKVFEVANTHYALGNVGILTTHYNTLKIAQLILT